MTHTFGYDAHNRATAISRAGHTETFKYDPDGQRFYRKDATNNKHTFYLYGGLYEETRIGAASTGYRNTQLTAAVQHSKDPANAETYLYLRRDHLGSVESIQDSSGNLIVSLAFDPFGDRRKADWSAVISKMRVENAACRWFVDRKRNRPSNHPTRYRDSCCITMDADFHIMTVDP